MARPESQQSTRPRWLIRVCNHGHRVEWHRALQTWMHMDADTDDPLCNDEEPPRVVEVVERADAATPKTGTESS